MFIFPIPLTIFTFDPPVFGIEIVGAEKPSFAICSAFISVAAEIENMKVLNKTICEMGEFLISAANAYQKVNEANQDGIR